MPGTEWLWEAWLALQSCRPFVGGMGVISLPLRWHDVQGYADHLGLSGDMAAILHYCIGGMDKAWLDHQAAEAEKRAKAEKGR